MGQNFSQMDATGSYTGGTTQDITTQAAWTVSDTTIATIGGATGVVTIQNAGKIWGATIGCTATLAPGSPGTGSLLIIASDSGSIAPLMPQENDHWVGLGLSPWGTWFGLQEPSGSMCVGSGSYVFALTASTNAGAGVGPQQGSTEPGWLRSFVVMTGSAAMAMGYNAVTSGPSMSASWAMLAYAHVGTMAPATEQFLGSLGNAATTEYSICTDVVANTGQRACDFNAFTKTMVGPITQVHGDRVHPYLIVFNSSSMQMLAATDICVMTSASTVEFLPVDGGQVRGFGGATGLASMSSGSYCYFAMCTGSVAEQFSNPQTAGSLLNKLGWNCQWASCPVDSGTINLPFLPFHWEGLGLVPWTCTYNFQEVNGNPQTVDSSPNSWALQMFLTANALDAYRYNLAAGWTNGWTRSGIMMTSNANRRVILVNPNPQSMANTNTGSFAWLTYASMLPLAGGARPVMGVGATSAGSLVSTAAAFMTGGLPVVYCAGATVTGTQNAGDGRVHPWLFVYDRTNSRVKLYTDLEKVTGSFVLLQPTPNLTCSLFIGGFMVGNNTPVSGVFNYAAFCTGTLAESFSTDGVASSFLKSLGWTVSY